MPFIWEKCPGCDDYVCNVHNQHASECQCPDIDTFLAFGIDPYTDEVKT